MLNQIDKLETKTQEITFVVSLLSAISVIITGLIYLFAKPESVSLFTGRLGSITLQGVFNTFGYSSFFIGINFLWMGSYLLQKIHSPTDFSKYYKKILFLILIQSFLLVLSASLLAIFQAWIQFSSHSSMLFGAGGLFGLRLGGGLYSLFGAYGSLSIIIVSTLVLSIVSGVINISEVLVSIASFLKIASLSFIQFFISSLNSILSIFHPVIEKNQFVQKVLYKAHKFIPQSRQQSQPVIEIKTSEPCEESIELREVALPDAPEGFDSYYKDEPSSEAKEEPKKTKGHRGRKKKVDTEATLQQGSSKNNKEEVSVKKESQTKAIEDAPVKPEMAVKAWTKKYNKPDLQILDKPTKAKKMSDKEVKEQSEMLLTHLESFQIFGTIVDVHQGPTLTMYEVQLKAGVKLSKVASLNDDLAMALGASSIRILAPIPGKTTIGIEIPNKDKRVVNLSELMIAINKEKDQVLPIPMGMNVNNETIISDLTKMPHMLVSGTTGSGKSVFINTLISSLIFNNSPKELRFVMVDPKMIELSPYNGIPHLLKPVVTDVEEAKHTLQWAEKEMDRRYKLLAQLGSKDIESFNHNITNGKKKKTTDFEWAPLPYLVIIIDELADLMMTQGKEVEIPITRIAQKARACGIHMVIATQRPSSDIITGLIKTNFPTRVACKVSSGIDSRTILDTAGAEKLFGLGDLLFLPNGKAMQRLQSAYISESEVKKLVKQASKNNDEK